MEKKEYAHIDLWKCIFAIAVIMIHTQPYRGCNDGFVWYFSSLFTRLAVPFFMITSSFFLGRKIREKGAGVIKKYRRVLWPKLLFWGILALLMNAVTWYGQSRNMVKTVLLVIQNAIFYPRGAMWFLFALIVSSFILEFLLKKKVPVVAIGMIAAVLFAFALLCNTYFFVVSETGFGTVIKIYLRYCISARNGLFLFIYMFIGYALSSDRMKRIRRGTLILWTVLGYGLLVAEAAFLRNVDRVDDSSLFLSYLILIPAFILLLTTMGTPVSHHQELRSISGVMYYTHPFFNLLLSSIMDPGVFRFVIVLVATVTVWIVTKTSKSKYVRLLLY